MFVMSSGIAVRGKCHTLMPSEYHKCAYTPPPIRLKPAPYVVASLSMYAQPVLSAPLDAHCVVDRAAATLRFAEDVVQPSAVWRVYWFVVWSWTPSRMSISPPFGQLGPTDYQAGHRLQPCGIA